VGGSEVRVLPVRSRRERRRFVDVARDLEPLSSAWVRPLDDVVLDALHPRRNPFYRDGGAQAFLATRNGRDAGRVLAHVWRRHERLHGERAGYFGFFECADDVPTATALLDAAAAFARDRGCSCLRGPFNMTAAQEIGVVTTGFEGAPSVDMVYTPPWVPRLLESAGFEVCLRMSTWRNPAAAELDPDALRGGRDRGGPDGLEVRALRSRRRDEDMERVREVINAAFLGNWCFVPITRDEWRLQVGTLIPLLDPTLVLIAEVQGVAVGVTLAVPDFNHVIRKLDGRLLHPATLGLLRRPIAPDVVVILFAVRKQYQGMGVSRRLNAELVRAMRRGGYRGLSITWIAEGNTGSLAQARALEMRPLHELAMYQRPI
jgi:GNAT superfamily N-acetyltransferase